MTVDSDAVASVLRICFVVETTLHLTSHACMHAPSFSLVRDVLSGLIMAATSIPQLVAYAETVGYASFRGLSTAGPPLLAWGLVTGSPFMNAGVTSLTALMAKADLDGEVFVQQNGEALYVNLVAAYSFWIGVASVVLALVGFGRVAQAVPKVVRQGFKWGCASGVLMAALPNGLLIGGSKEMKQLAARAVASLQPYKAYTPGVINVSQVGYLLTHPVVWNVSTTVLFVMGTLIVRNGKSFLPKSLPPGSEVILVTAGATLYSMYYDYPGAVVGEIPTVGKDSGLEILGMSIPVEFINVRTVLLDTPLLAQFGDSALRLAVSCLLFAAVNFLSIMGIASGFETENGIAWSPSRELLAQGAACAVAAAVGSAPVSGSLSRSLVSRLTGTTSQLACLVTALCWILLQPYMSIMSPTPKAALSAIIVSAVVQGVLVPKDLLRLEGIRNKVVGWGTGIATLLTSPTQGFGMGLVLYLLTMPLAKATPKKEKKA